MAKAATVMSKYTFHKCGCKCNKGVDTNRGSLKGPPRRPTIEQACQAITSIAANK